jgi:hypothetical protein
VDSIVANGLGPEWASFANGFINEESWIRIVQAGLRQTPATSGSRRN